MDSHRCPCDKNGTILCADLCQSDKNDMEPGLQHRFGPLAVSAGLE